MVETFHCGDIEKEFGSFNCCDSCHEDWDEFDISMVEKEVTIKGETKLAIICCMAWMQIDKKSFLDKFEAKYFRDEEVASDGGATSTPEKSG